MRNEEDPDAEAGRKAAKHEIAISRTTGVFFYAYEIGYGRCVKKVQKIFPKVDTSFLTLTDLDLESLVTDIMGGDPYSFIQAAMVTLDEKGRIIGEQENPASDPAPSEVRPKGRKPARGGRTPRAPRSRGVRKR